MNVTIDPITFNPTQIEDWYSKSSMVNVTNGGTGAITANSVQKLGSPTVVGKVIINGNLHVTGTIPKFDALLTPKTKPKTDDFL